MHLRVLIVDDDRTVASSIVTTLASGGFEPRARRVHTRRAYLDAMSRPFDVIISNYSLPSFDALDALQIRNAHRPGTPFIVVTEAGGEDVAVDLMRGGAADLVRMRHLSRLPAAVKRVLSARVAAPVEALMTAGVGGERASSGRDGASPTLVSGATPAPVTNAVDRALAARMSRERAESPREGRSNGVDGRDDVSARLLAAIRSSVEMLSADDPDGERIALVLEALARAADVDAAVHAAPVGDRGTGASTGGTRASFAVDQLWCADGDWQTSVDAGLLRLFQLQLDRGEAVSALIPAPSGDGEGARETRSVALVPVRFGNELAGVLGFESRHRERRWTSLELDALRTVADVLATTYARARFAGDAARLSMPPSSVPPPPVAWTPIPMPTTPTDELADTVRPVLIELATRVGADAAALFVTEPCGRTLRFLSGIGFRTRTLGGMQLRIGEGLAGRIAKTRCQLQIPALSDLGGLWPRSSLLADEGFRAYYGVPMLSGPDLKGVLEVFHRAPYHVDPGWVDLFDGAARQIVSAIERAELMASVRQSDDRLQVAYDETLEGWTRALDLRDRETEGHTRRVTETTVALARRLDWTDTDIIHVRRGALLHDIGKMGIPDRILHKPGPLTDAEWKTMRLHPVYAYHMLAPIEYLRPAIDIPYCHHERWDGSGYPRGLRGEEIPMAARIFAVVDVWDALTSDRPYRRRWSPDRTREYIASEAGTLFDPTVVESFLGSDLYARA